MSDAMSEAMNIFKLQCNMKWENKCKYCNDTDKIEPIFECYNDASIKYDKEKNKFIDVLDSEDFDTGFKYCPMCGRKL